MNEIYGPQLALGPYCQARSNLAAKDGVWGGSTVLCVLTNLLHPNIGRYRQRYPTPRSVDKRACPQVPSRSRPSASSNGLFGAGIGFAGMVPFHSVLGKTAANTTR
jgi:hypothetical protein